MIDSQERDDFNKKQKGGMVATEIEVTQSLKPKTMVTVTNLHQRLRKFGLKVMGLFP